MKTKLIIASVALVALTAGPAYAHISASPAEGPAGGYVTVDFEVPHGCEESPTTALSIQIPEGVGSVTPEEEAGWKIATSGSEEAVTEVTWTSIDTPLDPHHLARFGMSIQLPEGAPGDVVYFPTVQTCEQGATKWIQIPSERETEEDLESPAPAIVLTEGGDEHGGATEPADGDDAQAAGPTDVAVEPTSGTDEGADAVTWAALALGALGVLLGAAALSRARR